MANSWSGYRNRLAAISRARQLGTHEKHEWVSMKDFFNNLCCRCMGESGSTLITKDHIIPVCNGGSDSVKNIQPLCKICNEKKGLQESYGVFKNIDYRPMAAKKLNKELPKEWI